MNGGIVRNARRAGQWVLAIAVAAAAILGLARAASAHDIPASVIARVFIVPRGDVLHVVVRVPLAAMRDINFPSLVNWRICVSRGPDPAIQTLPLLSIAMPWLAAGHS